MICRSTDKQENLHKVIQVTDGRAGGGYDVDRWKIKASGLEQELINPSGGPVRGYDGIPPQIPRASNFSHMVSAHLIHIKHLPQ